MWDPLKLMLALQVAPNARKRFAPSNLTARIKLIRRTVGRKSVLHNSERCFSRLDRIHGEITGQVGGKRQRSAAGKIFKVRKQDALRRIENAHASGGYKLRRV